jgi:hypothetical protein
MVLEKESFTSRWSRRKQQVAEEADIAVAVEENRIVEEDIIDEEALGEQRLEKLNALTDEDMLDIETLNEDSDFSGFMSTGVSETLRKMALQKLFHGKTYNIRDGLDEYDGDYTSFEILDPSVITCDMKHILEVEAKKLLAEEKAKEEELLKDDADNEDVIEVAELDSEAEQQKIEGQGEIEDMVEEVTEIVDDLDTVNKVDNHNKANGEKT